MNRKAQATAHAPASVGNVAVGFDILGHSLAGPGDHVTVCRIDAPEVRIAAISGCVTALPREAGKNTAGAALAAMRQALGLSFGFEISIEKGIALGSGMGGSAASAVAALVAANGLLDQPLPRHALYPFALAGEAIASGGRHGDNIGPMLLGGLVLATADHIEAVPVPAGLTCALVHPHVRVDTRNAREVLQGPWALADFVAQSSHLARLLTACHRGDLAGLRGILDDRLIEPRRAHLVPGFAAVKKAALDCGVIGASISGGGPSVFAWCDNEHGARRAAQAMQAAFRAADVDSDVWISPVAGPAAEVIG